MLDSEATIECCTNNLDTESWALVRERGTEIDRQYCLQRCGMCHDRPFLVVNGEPVPGENYVTLLTALEGCDE